MRFLIRIDRAAGPAAGTATASITCADPGAGWARRDRTIGLVDDGRNGLMPVPETVPAAGQPHAALCGGDAAQFQKALANFRSRRSQGVDIFGRYLFEVMLGSDWWDAVRQATPAAAHAELALSWLPGDASHPFERLPWELMHDGAQPLVASNRPRVAITRVVADDPGASVQTSPGAIELPVRVLFVLGTSADDPSIRAATEVLGLLRSLEQPERVQARMIERAKPKDVAAAVKAFRPSIVHFLCHGEVRGARGYLELVPDDANDPERGQCNGTRLLAMLQPAPTIVVLGACRSAEQADFDEGSPALAPHELKKLPGRPVVLGSLAVELVRGGVPIVLGMGGRVADVAARLFTRRFEASLLEGAPIVTATSDARRAPFSLAHGGAKSVDWAYPILVLHASVAPDYAPTPEPKLSGPAIQLRDWAGALRFMPDKQPVFCSRHAFLEAFDALFESRISGMLAVYTSSAQQLGKSRLLEQFLFRALRSGHVPVVQSKRRDLAPTTIDGLLRGLDDEIGRISQQLGLDISPDLVMGEVASKYRGKPTNDEPTFQALKPFVTRLHDQADAAAAEAAPTSTLARGRSLGLQFLLLELGQNGLTGKAACLAIQHDLWELARAFRARLDQLRTAEVNAGRPVPAWLSNPDAARAVLLLDNADRFETSVLEELYEQVKPAGLGTPDDPIPIVATFMYDGTASPAVKRFVEPAKASVRPLELKPFAPGDDLLVYQRVLLNPFNETLFDDLGVSSATAFAVNPVEFTTNQATTLATEQAGAAEKELWVSLQGRPDKLGRDLYVAVALIRGRNYFVEARDADILRELGLI